MDGNELLSTGVVKGPASYTIFDQEMNSGESQDGDKKCCLVVTFNKLSKIQRYWFSQPSMITGG